LAVITDMNSASFLSPFGVRIDDQWVALDDPDCQALLSASACVVVAETWIQRQVRVVDQHSRWPAIGSDERVFRVRGERYLITASLDARIEHCVPIEFLADLEIVVPEADWMLRATSQAIGQWRSEGLNWLAACIDGQIIATECWQDVMEDANRIAAFQFRNQLTDSVVRLEDVYPHRIAAGDPC
jgi:hypothetical protein